MSKKDECIICTEDLTGPREYLKHVHKQLGIEREVKKRKICALCIIDSIMKYQREENK